MVNQNENENKFIFVLDPYNENGLRFRSSGESYQNEFIFVFVLVNHKDRPQRTPFDRCVRIENCCPPPPPPFPLSLVMLRPFLDCRRLPSRTAATRPTCGYGCASGGGCAGVRCKFRIATRAAHSWHCHSPLPHTAEHTHNQTRRI